MNFCSLSAMIARVNVAKSEARPIDKERIFEAVRNIEGGFDQVNQSFFEPFAFLDKHMNTGEQHSVPDTAKLGD